MLEPHRYFGGNTAFFIPRKYLAVEDRVYVQALTARNAPLLSANAQLTLLHTTLPPPIGNSDSRLPQSPPAVVVPPTRLPFNPHLTEGWRPRLRSLPVCPSL